MFRSTPRKLGRPGPARAPNADGFTLLEMVVVLAIIAVVMALSVPMFDTAFPGAQVKSAAHNLASGLRYTRDQAITTNRSTAFVINTQKRQYGMDGDLSFRKLPPELILSLKTAHSEVVDDYTGRIRFFPDGSSTGGRITLADRGRIYSVMVDWILGRVRVDEVTP